MEICPQKVDGGTSCNDNSGSKKGQKIADSHNNNLAYVEHSLLHFFAFLGSYVAPHGERVIMNFPLS